MNIINIANRQEIKKDNFIYYKVNNLGVFKCILKVSKPPFGNTEEIDHIIFEKFISFYKEEYFKNMLNKDMLNYFKYYFGIELDVSKNCNKQINNKLKNLKISFTNFITFVNYFDKHEKSRNVIRLVKEKYKYFNSFSFIKNLKNETYSDILKDKNYFFYNPNIYNSLKSSYNFNNYIKRVNEDNIITYDLKLKNSIITTKYLNHNNCCGFLYLNIDKVNFTDVDETVIDLYNYIFYTIYSNNKSALITLNNCFISNDIIIELIKKLKELKQFKKISNNKFLIHL